jgi:SAM-dependent methyltransferase
MKYGKYYFNWQKSVGEFGGLANKFKFEEYIKKDDVVLDFGSGGGYLLSNISCAEKVGVEVNKNARLEAEGIGVNSVKSIDEVSDKYVDVIISNHALEHVDCPLEIITKLKPKLKGGGKIVFVVPHQGPKETYKKGDINQHLYTWNPMTLGSLFEKAGYKNIRVSLIRHKWPKNYKKIYNGFGLRCFHYFSIFNAFLKRNYQIKVEAIK